MTSTHTEYEGKAGSRFAPQSKAEDVERVGQALGATRIRGDHRWQTLTEDLLRTGRLLTKEATGMEFQAPSDPQPG